MSVGMPPSSSVTTITQSGSAGNYSLTATVSGNANGNVAPTGSVSFQDTTNANYVLATAQLGVGASGLGLLDKSTTTVGNYPEAIVTADFNGDGIPDVATDTVNSLSNSVPGSLSILLGKGDGTFNVAPSIPTGDFPINMVTADFNGDGIPDIAIGTINTGSVNIFLGKGDGTFTAGPSLINGTFADVFGFGVGDFNGDGNEDLAWVDAQTKMVFVLLGHGDGTFTQVSTHPATGDNPVSIAVGDFNGDGKLDLAIDNVFAANGSLTATNLTILLGNGDGTFTAAAPVTVGIGPESIVTADFNGDGKLDLAVANIQPPATVMVLLGNGDGTFSTPVSTIPIVYLVELAVGDFNGDGKADIAATLENNFVPNVYALLGNGDGTFTTVIGSEPNIATSPVAADFNGDGRTDIAVMDQTDTVTVLLSEWSGDATATVTGISPVGTGLHYVDASYSGDSNFSPSISSTTPLTAERVPTTLALTASPANGIVGQLVTLTAVASPGIAQNHTPSGSVTFSYGSTTLGTVTMTNGTATFATATLPAGTDCITAQYFGDTNFLGSTSATGAFCFSVSPAGSTTLTEPVNSTSSGQIATLTFTASGTLGAINVLTLGAPNLDFKQTGGGSVNNPPCVVGTTYTSGQACTVFYTFTPSHPGIRYGGITLSTTSGTLLGNTYISGIGTGPQITWSPDQQAVLDNGLTDPRGMAVDGNGNTYVAQVSSLVQISAAGAIRNIPFSGDLQDVAVDGSGNVFVTNASYAFQEVVNEIVAVNGSIPATPEIRTFTGFGTVWAVAVDRNGNLFVTQSYSTGNDCALYELPAVNGSIPATPTILTVATTFGVSPCDPYGIAFDAGGNLFVADPQASAIYEILAVNGTIPASPTIRTVESGLIDPAYIALDAAGDIFAADFRSTVYEMLAVNGTVPSTNPTILKLSSGLKIPAGVAVDGSGNVFISDVGLNQIFKLDYADPPTLTFATTPAGQTSTDSPKTVTMTNDGNEPLIFTVPSTDPNPTITTGFTLGSASSCPQLTSTTSSAGTLAAGASCNYSVSFTPVAPGLDSGFLVPTDNNLNIVNATQKVPLNGTGTGATLAPTVISISPHSGPTTGGTTVTITGTNFTAVTAVDFGALAATSFIVNSTTQITAVSPAAPVSTVDVTVLTPGGTSATSPGDQFTYIDATQAITFPAPPRTAYAGTAVNLNASASSGLPVTYTVVSGPAYVTGSTLTYTAAGSVVVEADQAGNSSYGPAPPVQITLKPILLTEPVATGSAAIPTVVIFSAAGTLASINVLTQGAANLDFTPASGSICATGTTYAAGQTCTIDFTFTPTRPGLRYGGISLTDSSGDLLASSYIFGEGIGPMVTYSPGTESLVGSGLSEPSGVALDGNGDIFASNNSGTTLTEIQAGTGTVVQIGSFVAGDDVAVDGNGNVFVASNRSTISEVMAVNGSVPASPVINTIASSFTAINGIKVDANGDVFVACSSSGGTNVGIYEIVAVNGTIPANPTILTLSTAFTGPTGIAIDASGDVFVSDELTGQLDEMLAVNGSIPANPTIVTVASGFNEPANVSLDGTGNVFVAEYGGQDVKEILAVNGSIPANPTVLTLQPATPGGAIPGFGPEGLFIDGSGNVYVADAVSTGVVKMDFSDPPTLTFADTYVGQTSTDSPQTVTTFNDGNAPLNYTVPGTGFNPAITPGFTVGNTSTCPQLSSSSSPATLAAGASCTNLVSFTPVAAGLDSGFLTTTDNALNVVNATQLVPLNGIGKVNPTPVVTLTGTPNPVFLLNPVTFTATVSSPAFQPTGSVTFLDGTTPLGTVALNGGVATLTTSTLAMGLHPITAVYTGPNFPSQTSPVLLELVEDFSLTITNPDVVIPHGGTAVYNLVVMTVGGTVTASTIDFGIAGSPDHSPVTFAPATVATGSGTTNITLTIKTPDYPVGPWSSIVRPPVVLALTAFGALLLPFGRRRRRALLARRLVAVAVLATFAMLSGCGSGWKTQHYSITVTASAGPLSHSASATLTSKQ
jgi:hypothetical protein